MNMHRLNFLVISPIFTVITESLCISLLKVCAQLKILLTTSKPCVYLTSRLSINRYQKTRICACWCKGRAKWLPCYVLQVMSVPSLAVHIKIATVNTFHWNIFQRHQPIERLRTIEKQKSLQIKNSKLGTPIRHSVLMTKYSVKGNVWLLPN